MSLFKTDIAIIGGGASGLFTAAALQKLLSKQGIKWKIIIIEKEPRVGKKLLRTGNGRCNLSNEQITNKDYSGSFNVSSFLEEYTPERLLAFFEELGLLCKKDAEGRIYPFSNAANSVLDVLRLWISQSDIEEHCDITVSNIERKDTVFNIYTNSHTYVSKICVVSSGSSASINAFDNSVINALQRLGHSFNDFLPALCPIPVESKILASLKGIRAHGKISIYDGKSPIAAEEGEIQFTEKAVSGICVFNLSEKVYGLENPMLGIDLMPSYTYQFIFDLLWERKNNFPQRNIDELFVGILHKRLGISVLKHSNCCDFSKKNADLSRNEIKKISETVKNFSFVILPDRYSMKLAQVAIGGVHGTEINEKTMESKRQPGLYLIGETVDCNGKCGGFNLHFAFSSALCAAENILKSLK